ncbi:MAG TPA: chloride channel protein [Acidobacteriaceae bacterium]|nr:chloride channel protein [Acidobacteriaceae bacterium]
MNRLAQYPLLRRYAANVQGDLAATYARNLHKWLLIAPLIGLSSGLAIAAVAEIILGRLWPVILAYYLGHHWAIVPGLALGCAITGLIMQHFTDDPNEHSTEEVIRSYHLHEGHMDMRAFPAKLVAAVATVSCGGSAALEGPSIYGGAAMGSWLWTRLQHLRRLRLERRDRRIMLICGAAAGMSAVFRAPLTGIVFALEMPYKDDLAHEALLPSLIASVVSYLVLSAFLGSQPLFNFASSGAYTVRDLLWCAVLGLVIGMLAMVFVISFRRLRSLVVRWGAPHWIKLTLGGTLTGLCGLAFLQPYPGALVPIGPNYEAVGQVLSQAHGSRELVVFGLLKLAATAFTLGAGGVSAMFVPLFLTGGVWGIAFAQTVVHSGPTALFAAVGMASFIAAAYKTPLAAVVFVAEATGGHAFIIPALIGSAVAYAISGDASISHDQRLHERSGEHRRDESQTSPSFQADALGE